MLGQLAKPVVAKPVVVAIETTSNKLARNAERGS